MASQKVSDPGRIRTYSDEPAEAFRVKLRDNKQLVIKAGHKFEALEKYKFACGIISTDNDFDVEPVTDEAGIASAVDLPVRPNAHVPESFAERTGREPETKLGTFGV